jgi:hypothetical protein
MEDGSGSVLFDGHNDAIQFIAEYRAGGRDFLERSDDGHLDLVRAREGGLIGGIFASPSRNARPQTTSPYRKLGMRCALQVRHQTQTWMPTQASGRSYRAVGRDALAL